MKTIFFLLFLSSHVIGLETYSLALFERSARTRLSHGEIAYYAETKRFAHTGSFTTSRIIDLAGIRINFVLTSAYMGKKFIRMIHKTNYSLKAGSKHENILLNCLIMKIMIEQSWVAYIWQNYYNPGNAFVSTSGPGFEAYNQNISTLHVGLFLMAKGLKTMTFSSAELSSMKARFLNQNDVLNDNPSSVSNAVFNKFISASPPDLLYQNAIFPEIRGFPYHGISKMFMNSFTLQNCASAIKDWAGSPLEILIVENETYSDITIIDAVSPLWEAQLPRTDYKANRSATGFITLGKEIIIPCQGGISGEVSLLLVVNLGPLSAKSLIAADLVITQFQTYANANGKLENSGVTYQCTWAPCSGCAIVMIQLVTPPTRQVLPDKTNQFGMIREAVQQFRMNFTLQEISTNLVSNWSDSLGINQQNRDLWNWFVIQLESLGPYSDWWLETFGSESSFADLRNLASGIPSNDLYEDIYEIIQISFLPRSKRFDLWIFEKA